MKNNLLGLVAKFPEPGRVKTRLARDIGSEHAAKIYKAIAEDVFRKTRPCVASPSPQSLPTGQAGPPLKGGEVNRDHPLLEGGEFKRDRVSPGGAYNRVPSPLAGEGEGEGEPPGQYERIIIYSPAEMRRSFEEWLPGETLMPQRGRDVGEVMENALEDLLAAGAGKAVLVGVDIPGLNRGIINESFSRLDNADIVIGPAEDGGYYLIGMKSLHPKVFRNIPWGTDTVFSETISVMRRLGLQYETVDTLFDVDRLEDLEKAGYGEYAE